jgi:hypothetical protein
MKVKVEHLFVADIKSDPPRRIKQDTFWLLIYQKSKVFRFLLRGGAIFFFMGGARGVS